MVMCIQKLKRDFWKLVSALIIMAIFNAIVNFSFEITIGRISVGLSILSVIVNFLFVILCAVLFFNGQKYNFAYLLRKYWSFPIFYLILNSLITFLLLFLWASLRIPQQIQGIPILEYISSFPIVVWVFLFISIANNISYLKGSILSFENYKIFLVKILIYYLVCRCFLSICFHKLIINTTIDTILYIFLWGILQFVLPVYYVFSVLSGENGDNLSNDGKETQNSDLSYDEREFPQRLIDGLTILMRAVYNEDKEAVEKILYEQPDIINKTNPNTGVSALWMAAAYGNIEIIKILLASGADLTNKNKEGLSPADIAGKMGHKSAAELILSYMNDLN